MKTKNIFTKFFIIFFSLITILEGIFSTRIYAKIDDKTGAKLGDNDAYIEIIDPDNNDATIEGTLVEMKNSGSSLGTYTVNLREIRKNDTIRFHIYIQWATTDIKCGDNEHTKFGIIENGEISDTSTGLTVNKEKYIYKRQAWAGFADGDNASSIEFDITPLTTGDITIDMGAYAETKYEFFGTSQTLKFTIKINGVKKSLEEEEVDNMLATLYKDPSNANSTDKQKVLFFAAGDIKNNNANQIKAWDSQTIKSKLDIIKTYSISSVRQYEKQYWTNTVDVLESLYQAKLQEEAGKEVDIDSVVEDAKERFEQIIVTVTDPGETRLPTTFTDVFDNIESYIPGDSDDGIEELTGKASIILTIITNIAMIVAVLMLAIIGLKYMLGSVEEKAEYKKDMIPYLVGAALVFSITVIVKVLQQFGQSINNI